MSNNQFRSLQKIGFVAVLLALVATACGASAEQQLAQQLTPAIKATPYGDDLVADCATDALLTEIGAEALGADGVTPERLREDPAILTVYLEESDTAPEIVATCLDARQNFAAAFAAAVDKPDSAECAASEVADERAFEHTVAVVRSEDPEVDPEDDRDLAVKCLDDTAAASFLGLPSSGDIAAPLTSTLADTRVFLEDDAACIAASITGLGALRLDEIGLTPASVGRTFATGDYDFSADEFDVIQSSLMECVDVREALALQFFDTFPKLEECLSPELTNAQLLEWSSAELVDKDSSRRLAEKAAITAATDCADERDLAAFGQLSADDALALGIGRNLLAASEIGPLASRTLSHEYVCAGRALLASLTNEEILRLDEIVYLNENPDTLYDELAQDAKYFDFLVALMNGRSVCMNGKTIVQDAFFGLDFSEETLRCIYDSLTLEEIRSAFNDGHYLADISTVKPVVSAAEYFSASDATELAVQDCGSPGERGRWDEVLEAIDGDGGGVSALRSNDDRAPTPERLLLELLGIGG